MRPPRLKKETTVWKGLGLRLKKKNTNKARSPTICTWHRRDQRPRELWSSGSISFFQTKKEKQDVF
jgi:hypothetical protein